MNRVIKIIFLTALSLLLSASLAHAAQYYVSTGGSGTANGTSTSTPWTMTQAQKSLQHVAATGVTAIQPGDTVSFNGANTFTASGADILHITFAGTPSSRVTLNSYGAGVATFSSGIYSCITGTDLSGLTITDLAFTGTPSNATNSGGVTTQGLVNLNFTVTTGRASGDSITNCTFNGGYAGMIFSAGSTSSTNDLCGCNSIEIAYDLVTNSGGQYGILLFESQAAWSGHQHFSGLHIHNCKVAHIQGLSSSPGLGTGGICPLCTDATVPIATDSGASYGAVTENNDIEDIGYTGHGAGAIIPETCRSCLVRWNTINGVYADGHAANSYSGSSPEDGLGIDGSSMAANSNVLLEDNLIVNCGTAVLIDGPYTNTTSPCVLTIRDNLAIGCYHSAGGIFVNGYNGGFRHFDANLGNFCYVYNNTIIAPAAWNTYSASGTGYPNCVYCWGTGFEVLNNIFEGGSTTTGVVFNACDSYVSPNGAATIANGGTGYVVNDVVTLAGGTLGTGGTVTKYNVTAVSGGVVTALSMNAFGNYQAFPTSVAATTGGTGTGLTVNVINTVPVVAGNQYSCGLYDFYNNGTAQGYTLSSAQSTYGFEVANATNYGADGATLLNYANDATTVQLVTFTGAPTTATLAVTAFGSTQVTSALTVATVTAAQAATALNALTNTGNGTTPTPITVTGPTGGPLTVTFGGTMAYLNIPPMAIAQVGGSVANGMATIVPTNFVPLPANPQLLPLFFNYAPAANSPAFTSSAHVNITALFGQNIGLGDILNGPPPVQTAGAIGSESIPVSTLNLSGNTSAPPASGSTPRISGNTAK